MIKEVFPTASVKPVVVAGRTVSISCGGVELVSCSQRDLYAKYGHPARGAIIKNLKLYRQQQQH